MISFAEQNKDYCLNYPNLFKTIFSILVKIIDRIKAFIDYKGVTLNAFNVSIGAGKGYIEKQIQRGGSIGGDVLETIVRTFPELNPTWLLIGEGEMIKKPSKTANTPSGSLDKKAKTVDRLHLPPSAHEHFDRENDRKMTGSGDKEADFSAKNEMSENDLKDEIIKAKNEQIDSLKKMLDMQQQLVEEKERFIEVISKDKHATGGKSGHNDNRRTA